MGEWGGKVRDGESGHDRPVLDGQARHGRQVGIGRDQGTVAERQRDRGELDVHDLHDPTALLEEGVERGFDSGVAHLPSPPTPLVSPFRRADPICTI